MATPINPTRRPTRAGSCVAARVSRHAPARELRAGWAHLRKEAALDDAVHELHVLALDLELLAVFQLHHVPPGLPVEAEDDARLPVVLRSLCEPGDLDARVGSQRRHHRLRLGGIVDDSRVQPGVVRRLGGGCRRAGVA